MKKFSILLLMLTSLFFVSIAFANDIDLSGMTTAELIELQNKVNEALWKSENWNEVIIPRGIYEIGKEIPAGEWMLYQNGNEWSYYRIYDQYVNGKLSGIRSYGSVEEGEPVKVSLSNGKYIEISNYSVIFKTYIPSFTFK